MSSVIALLVLVLLSACSSQDVRPSGLPVAIDLSDRTSEAVDHLLGYLSPPLWTGTPVLVASFVDLNDTSVSTKLGRLIAEQTAEHLIQRGFRVREPRLTHDLGVKDDGVYILPRGPNEELRDKAMDTGVVIAGTTTSVGGITYVNMRMIRYADGVALAASDIRVPDRLAR